MWEIAHWTASVRKTFGEGPGIRMLWPSALWTEKDPNTGKTSLDEVRRLAAAGWDLVSVTPLNNDNGGTENVLYTFKRLVK